MLVQGGAGAVGHMAVQIAALSGAEVIATVSSAAKGAVAAGGGARRVVNYRREDVVARVRDLTGGQGVDRVIEVDLAANMEADVELLRPHGTIASYSSTSGPELPLAYYPLALQGPAHPLRPGLPASGPGAPGRDPGSYGVVEHGPAGGAHREGVPARGCGVRARVARVGPGRREGGGGGRFVTFFRGTRGTGAASPDDDHSKRCRPRKGRLFGRGRWR